jgi:ribonuclease HII
MILPTLDYERRLWKSGIRYVAGIDEVGRGALAGPVVAGAVIFDTQHEQIQGVRDSKTLSKNQKLELHQLLSKHCLYSGIGQSSAAEIDELGIVAATALAITRALKSIPVIEHLLIDGRPFKDTSLLSNSTKTFIVKGDSLSYSIAAASILAKVYRDAEMIKILDIRREYQFEKNVGYGTKYHLAALKKFGPTAHHRQCFLTKLLSSNPNAAI